MKTVVTLVVGLLATLSVRAEPSVGTSSRIPEGAETTSLLGRPLFAPPLTDDVRRDRETKLASARERFEAEPSSLEALIWYGRRTAYLGRYREAIEIYGRGLDLHPDEPRLYRHRGHRYITLRRFDRAIRDLERAAELTEGRPDRVEEDGLPNARNQPTSTLQSNIWYHLGLAYFLKADFENALRCYRRCLEVSGNPDMLCATSHWLYMTQRRLGRDDDARKILEPIGAEMDIIENHAYHRLLLMYRGEIAPEALLEEVRSADGTIDSATVGFGLANWYWVEGDRRRALELMRAIVASPQWAAFGAIAAEADLARSKP